jgi:flagellar basal-body rod modification protein FlgD
MEVPAVSAEQAQPASASASRDLADNFDNFLKLLITQLQHQDPLSPMDTNEFTSQLVQFASVEQSIATNANLETLIAMQGANRTAALVGYLGLRIEANGDTSALADGRAEWNYALPEQADEVTLQVSDQTGKAVYSADGMTGAGAHRFVWDGLDETGAPLPEGEYRLKVTAKDANGEAIATTITAVGTVTGIETAGEQPLLFVGKTGIPLDEVLAILGPPADQGQAQQQEQQDQT